MNPRVRSLSPGDGVSVVAPAGPVDDERLDRGLATLERWGLTPRPAVHVRDRHGYLAGDDAHRADDLVAAFGDPTTRAVLYARGGYGTTRLLPRLPLQGLGRAKKLLVGFSDMTALGLALNREDPFPYLYAPSVAELGAEPLCYDEASLRAGLFGKHEEGRQRVEGLQSMRSGDADGLVVGGCLSLVVALLGTPFEPDYRGKILFLEEVNEEPYRLDRMLTHLALAGTLGLLAGLLVGQLTGCDGADGAPTAEDVVRSFAARVDGPVLAGLPAGHGEARITIPLGVRAVVDGAVGAVTFHHA